MNRSADETRDAMAATSGADIHPQLDADNPWPGLFDFREVDSKFFRGREQESRDLLRLVLRERVAVFYGASGRGKSSLVQAGLFPLVRAQDVFPVYIRLNLEPAALPLPAQIIKEVHSQALSAGIETPPQSSGETPWEYFHRDSSWFWLNNRIVTPLIVFDQFEELFGRVSDERFSGFVDSLASLASGLPSQDVHDRLNVHAEQAETFDFERHAYRMLFVIREDYIAELDRIGDHIPAMKLHWLRLEPMRGVAALQVVNQAPHLIDPVVAENVIRFVAGNTQDPLPQLQVDPAILSLVCRELNSRRGSGMISETLLEQSRDTILHDFYERSVEDLPESVREFIEKELVIEPGLRENVALAGALRFRGITNGHLETLVKRRLIRIEERGGPRVELAHDVLAPVVIASKWRREEVEAAADAERLRLEAEQTRLEAERRKREQFERLVYRWAIAAALMALFFIAGIAWYAFRKGAEAERNRQHAQAEATKATSAKTLAERTAAENKQLAAKYRLSEANAIKEKNAADAARKLAESSQRDAEAATKEQARLRAVAQSTAADEKIARADAEIQRRRAEDAAKKEAEAARAALLEKDLAQKAGTELAENLAIAQARQAGQFLERGQTNQALLYLASALKNNEKSSVARSLLLDFC